MAGPGSAASVADIKDTKVCRRFRGAHPTPSAATSVILRDSRWTLAASSGVQTAEANTSPWSSHKTSAASRPSPWCLLAAEGGRFWSD
jgi:hypothetical protein